MNKERKNSNKKASKRLFKQKNKPLSKVADINSAQSSRQKKQKKRKISFYYSLLTIVLLICLIQITFGAVLNISKTIAYRNKITTIKKIRDEAEVRNNHLRKELNNFSTTSSLEAIARNNLKMAGDDEVLIIINKAEQKQQQEEDKRFRFNMVKNGKQ